METIYQAGPLFSEAERAWHSAFSAELEKAGYTVIWPGSLLTEKMIKQAGDKAVSLIFETCKNAIEKCSMVVALLDGTQVDDGTAWEVGYAYAKGIPVYGIRTDFRAAGDTIHNLVNSMIEGCLQGCTRSVPELLTLLAHKKK